MGVAPKKQWKMPLEAPSPRKGEGKVQDLRGKKVEAEALRDQLQKRIFDNPKVAQKAAQLIAFWLNRPKKKS